MTFIASTELIQLLQPWLDQFFVWRGCRLCTCRLGEQSLMHTEDSVSRVQFTRGVRPNEWCYQNCYGLLASCVVLYLLLPISLWSHCMLTCLFEWV